MYTLITHWATILGKCIKKIAHCLLKMNISDKFTCLYICNILVLDFMNPYSVITIICQIYMVGISLCMADMADIVHTTQTIKFRIFIKTCTCDLRESVWSWTYDIFSFLFDWNAHLERYILLKTPPESDQWFQSYEQLKDS